MKKLLVWFIVTTVACVSVGLVTFEGAKKIILSKEVLETKFKGKVSSAKNDASYFVDITIQSKFVDDRIYVTYLWNGGDYPSSIDFNNSNESHPEGMPKIIHTNKKVQEKHLDKVIVKYDTFFLNIENEKVLQLSVPHYSLPE